MSKTLAQGEVLAEKGSGLHWIVGAGIVGADIGTSVFYGTGILFPIVGYLAPVFVLTTCLMMWLFKMTYEEGLALSPYNGGAYSMILRSLGRRVAVLAGALTFVSYLATAAVSALSGAHYLSSLFDHTFSGPVTVFVSFIPIVMFGLLNTRGIKEPAKIVTAIAGIHFGLLLIIAIWGFSYLALNYQDIDFTKFNNLKPNGELTIPILMYGFAAAFLGITGFESAAQIVEELQQPTLVTVKKLYKIVVVLVSLTAPAISFLCLILLTQDQVHNNLDTLLSQLANKLGGKVLLSIIVLDATLTLFAATNTAFVGFIGLATTMSKQGNLPQFLLKRLAHRYPSIQGYPLIALPFMFIAMLMSGLVAGEVEVVAKVYEIAFLGVMVSFCVGVVLMRNRIFRRDTPVQFLTKWTLSIKNRVIPTVPLFSGIVLAIATFTLIEHAHADALLMLTSLLSLTLLSMAYYRWGVLEERLETRHDLRLGIGKFSAITELPEDLPHYVLCAGGTGARRLINKALKYLIKEKKGDPFELVIFHAEENKDPEGFFFELLQRVVSQQIAPVYSNDCILSVKILPGSFSEGLHTLKRSMHIESLMFGTGKDKKGSEEIKKEIEEELEINVISLD
ncbi:MAG: APC family permease [Bdellovibrionales bacterium]|nr:APC family permease [Bdellovibrionales bacterium]